MNTTAAINAAITELSSTISTLGRFPETDTAATVALLSATTARAFLRDALEAAVLDVVDQCATVTTQTTNKPKRITASHPFHHRMFSVSEGIPADDALAWASCLLESARDAAFLSAEASNTEAGCAMYGAGYLIEMAKAVVDAATRAIYAEEMDSAA